MDTLYRDVILDHYKHPHNFGTLKNPDVTHEESNPLCGDKICIQIKLQTTNYKLQTIKDIMFSGEGCAISIASASMLTEKVKGMLVEDVKNMKSQDIIDLLGIILSPARIKCALLSLETLQKCIALVNK